MKYAEKQRRFGWAIAFGISITGLIALLIFVPIAAIARYEAGRDKCFVQLDIDTSTLRGAALEADPSRPWTIVAVKEIRIVRVPWNVDVPEATQARLWVGCP